MLKREDCRFRRMERSDLDLVLRWRNSERIREAMYTDHVITRDEHYAWFERVTRNNATMHFVFEREGRPLGVVNVVDIDRRNLRCVWGFYIGEEDAPRGSGTAMGYLALECLFENEGLHRIIGEALADNEASIKYHRRLGFVEEGRLVEHVVKNGRYMDVISFAIIDRVWRATKDSLAATIFTRSA
ncbi:MAG: UDP-4-amino-4,6-dideoxy-N-acetyl-beta-L-altrosamine N-acetyltransferase [candidate division Zixibacteria bacterium]|nr:UDP-4-amino-4,6-dideoxy-N-acetyl-beta-L-altrosamine N-acetyltransferase [candidate division Zixibacteria bacterium]